MNHPPAWELVLELETGSTRDTAPAMARALPSEAVRDRFVGATVGGAVGDALGRRVERWERADVRATYPGGLRDYVPRRGWVSGPTSTARLDGRGEAARLQMSAAAPRVDHLFDRGFITFEGDGELVVSERLEPEVLDAWAIELPRNVGGFNVDQRHFLEHHRAHVLLAG